ncbi:MAG: adenine phosphoribosyltransferase [Candidatus Methanoplasma sp.]|jgi:adenine phosphoribosyltransferase|nr:adenine phosphoribosyltransferase [Candidatus Methanoplasma sp.]
MHEKLKASIMSSPIISMNGYPYLVHPVTDGIPMMEPDILEEIIDWMLSACSFDCDRILAPESMGIPLAVPISLKLRIPYTVIRKRQYGLNGEITASYRTGYSDRSIYINGLKKGDRVVIVDDILSTGGTLAALVSSLKTNGILIEDVLVVLNKNSGKEELDEHLGINVKRMLDIYVEKDSVTISEPLD